MQVGEFKLEFSRLPKGSRTGEGAFEDAAEQFLSNFHLSSPQAFAKMNEQLELLLAENCEGTATDERVALVLHVGQAFGKTGAEIAGLLDKFSREKWETHRGDMYVTRAVTISGQGEDDFVICLKKSKSTDRMSFFLPTGSAETLCKAGYPLWVLQQDSLSPYAHDSFPDFMVKVFAFKLKDPKAILAEAAAAYAEGMRRNDSESIAKNSEDIADLYQRSEKLDKVGETAELAVKTITKVARCASKVAKELPKARGEVRANTARIENLEEQNATLALKLEETKEQADKVPELERQLRSLTTMLADEGSQLQPSSGRENKSTKTPKKNPRKTTK